jgi:sodium transport system ATP-binding protein
MRELIRQLRAQNTTILLSSHILREIMKECDYVMFIRHGEIFQFRGQTMFSIEEIENSEALESLFLDLIHE